MDKIILQVLHHPIKWQIKPVCSSYHVNIFIRISHTF